MKRALLIIISIICAISLRAQIVILSEDFSGIGGNAIPANWQVSNNTDVHAYQRPLAFCQTDSGLQTPAVGKNAPSRFILPTLTYDTAYPIVRISLSLFVMDANLRCTSIRDSFPCPTYVRVMLIKSSYAGGTNAVPPSAFIYAEQTYRLRNANGNNTISFKQPGILNGETYRIYFDFKTAESSNCSGSGIKFVFDDFVVDKSVCGDECPPVANDDYFDGNRQNYLNVLKANVYGGFLVWSSAVRDSFEMQSLSIPPAVNSGLDYDDNNHPLSSMQFKLVSDPKVENTQCSSGAPAGTLIWNGDGSFQYTRTNVCVNRVSFKYKIIDPTGLESDTAMVIMDFVANSPLPVSFYSFAGHREKTTVTLNWQTASESNCKGFYVQRNSGDGWNDRGFVFSAADDGNSTSMLSYEFGETNVSVGATQYRLAQVDMNGVVSYSKIIVVPGTDQKNTILVYPNPSSSGSVTVVFPQVGNYMVELFDATGKKLKEWKKLNDGLLVISSLQTGMYLVKVRDIGGSRDYSARIVVSGF